MISKEIIFAGFGGQGILYMGQMMAYVANDQGMNVCWLPSYGPEMRGGTANCMVTFSDEEVYSPMILKADIVVAMNKPSMLRFEKVLRPGGVLFINSDLVDEEPTRNDVKIYKVAVDSIAEELGNAKVANMATLGAVIGVTDVFDLKDVEKVVTAKTPESKKNMLDLNLTALHRGYDAVRQEA